MERFLVLICRCALFLIKRFMSKKTLFELKFPHPLLYFGKTLKILCQRDDKN